MKLTKPQKQLVLRMFNAGPRRVHLVGAMGFRLETMRALHGLGLAERTDQSHAGLWKGRLTAAGRRLGRELSLETSPVPALTVAEAYGLCRGLDL